MLTAVVAVLVAMVAACTPAQVLTGTVRDEASAVVAGAQVRVHILWGPVVGEATTDAAGRYQIDSLPPDRYRIEVIPPAGYERAWHPAAATDVDAGVVDLVAGATVDADVVVPIRRHLRLGSPGNAFGNQLTASCPQAQADQAPPCGPQPMVWAAINGPYTTYANGDPYATKCTATNTGQSNKAYCDNGGAPRNPLYRPTGYAYAVDVAPEDVGTPLTVEVYDATSTERTYHRTQSSGYDCDGGLAPFNGAPYAGASWTNQQCQTGDTGGTWNPTTGTISTPGVDINELNMQFSLFQNDGSDATVTFAALQRSSIGGADCRLTALAGINASAEGYKNAWKAVCTFVPTMSGVYPLRVQDSGIDGVSDNGDAFNAFSLRITGGTATALRPLDDISTWFNAVGSSSTLYLADLGTEQAGTTLTVDLFDVGDGSGPNAFTLQLLAPPSGTPVIVPATGNPVGCSYNATPNTASGGPTPDQAATCTITTKNASSSTGLYNGGWLRLSLPIPADYSCSTDCWWTVHTDFGGSSLPTDRTVWTVHLA